MSDPIVKILDAPVHLGSLGNGDCKDNDEGRSIWISRKDKASVFYLFHLKHVGVLCIIYSI